MKIAEIEYKESKMTGKKSIVEFRESGLLLLVNQFLHIFGWAIIIKFNSDGEIIDFYPAHCKFRGFSEKSTNRAYKRVTKHLKKRIPELLDDVETIE